MGGYGPQGPDGSDLSDGAASDIESDLAGAHGQPNVNVNERRTRRGVYAVLDEKDDDGADEQADEDSAIELGIEADTASELTSLPPSRASVPLTSFNASVKGLMTPDPETAPSADVTPSSSIRRRVRSVVAPIISTRGQKARAAQQQQQQQQLVTPPLSEDTASIAESVSEGSTHPVRAPSVRGRSAAQSRLSTPAESDARGKGKEKETMCTESDGRVLRGRQSAPSSDSRTHSCQRPFDEKDQKEFQDSNLPTCATCLRVLPIISLDRRVVWGDFENVTGKGKGKKKEKLECPRCAPTAFSVLGVLVLLSFCSHPHVRCLRHYAIYEHPWPYRTAVQAAAIPTPREGTPAEPPARNNMSHKLLTAVDKKLTQTASSSKRHRDTSIVADDRESQPIKRRKADPGPGLGRPRVEMSACAKQVLLAGRARGRGRVYGHIRSGRPQLPTPKVVEGDQPVKRKRGRPPLHPRPDLTPPVPVSAPIAKPEPSLHVEPITAPLPVLPLSPISVPPAPTSAPIRTAKSRAVDDQPRESNGRFGKKPTTNGKFVRRKFAGLAARRARAQRIEVRSKVLQDVADPVQNVIPVVDRVGAELPIKRVRPINDFLEGTGTSYTIDGLDGDGLKSVGGLSFSPNPASFARRKWAPMQAPMARPARSMLSASAPPLGSPQDNSRSDAYGVTVGSGRNHGHDCDRYDSDGPVTPEDLLAPSVVVPDESVTNHRTRYAAQQPSSDVGGEEDESGVNFEEVPSLVKPTRRSLQSVGALWKPSPVLFAQRRWSSTTTHPDEVEDHFSASGHALSRHTSHSTRASLGLGDLGYPNVWTRSSASSANWDLFDFESSSGEEVC